MVSLSVRVAGSGEMTDWDLQQYISKNPDGQKFEFVRDYIISLSYLQANVERRSELLSYNSSTLDEPAKVSAIIQELLNENLNYRIARNLLDRYVSPENGLILKTTDLFMKLCNEQIAINNQERELLTELYGIQTAEEPKEFDKQNFIDVQRKLAQQRKKSHDKLLEASIFVTKVLVSTELDKFGEFTKLGITEAQRSKLLSRLNKFEGENFHGELREGQTYLQASIATIRKILEDFDWDTLDG